jgi:hypothetical protein
MLWIRISTGQLCIEVNDSQVQDFTSLPWIPPRHSNLGVHLTSDTNAEEYALSSTSLAEIHDIFSGSIRRGSIHIADAGTILLGSLSWPTASHAHLLNPFASVPLSDGLGLLDVAVEGWKYVDSTYSSWNDGLVVLSNGWTLYYSPLF